jgi:hypothetical protein
MAGESPLPDSLRPTHNLKTDFNAVGDGEADDTTALREAIAGVPENSILYLPAGRYKLTSQLRINKRMVIIGDGSDQSVLVMPRSLSQVFRPG